MTACAVCGAPSPVRPVLGDLEQCTECSFIRYQATEAELANLYDEAYFAGREYADYLGQQDALRRSMRLHLRQMSRFHPLQGALLEIGCAYGLFLDEARAHFHPVVGVDVCEGPLGYARESLRLDARAGNFLTLDLGTTKFDTICMWDTIEHVAAPDAFLRRAREILSPGGMLFLTTGDIGSLIARLRGEAWRQIHPPSHLNYFSRSTISTLLARSGFEVAGVETAAYYHTVYNVLASIRLRRRLGSRAADAALSLLGDRIARRIGVWINMGDIMFVAARGASSSA
jgi:SAM-dependent methyltransferase